MTLENLNYIDVIDLLLGIIGIIGAIIGVFNLVVYNKFKNYTKGNNSGIINQAQVINNGLDSYAIIKLTREITQEQLEDIVQNLKNTEKGLNDVKEQISQMPRIFTGPEKPKDPKEGDIWLKGHKREK